MEEEISECLASFTDSALHIIADNFLKFTKSEPQTLKINLLMVLESQMMNHLNFELVEKFSSLPLRKIETSWAYLVSKGMNYCKHLGHVHMAYSVIQVRNLRHSLSLLLGRLW